MNIIFTYLSSISWFTLTVFIIILQVAEQKQVYRFIKWYLHKLNKVFIKIDSLAMEKRIT